MEMDRSKRRERKPAPFKLGAEQIQLNLSSVGVGSVFPCSPISLAITIHKAPRPIPRVTNNATNNQKIRPHFARQGLSADAVQIERLVMQDGAFCTLRVAVSVFVCWQH